MHAEDRPRLLPDEPFPAYAYVPGHFPHPMGEDAGHHFGGRSALSTVGDDWRNNDAYRFGVDLFNHGYYWEAHEVWESLWHVYGRRGTLADFLKGLIQLSAAGVKVRQGIPRGVRSLAQGAERLFEQTMHALPDGQTHLFGLDPTELFGYAQEAERFAESAEPRATLEPVAIVFSFVLTPRNDIDSGKET